MMVRGLLIDIVGFAFIEKDKDRLQVDQYTCRRFFYSWRGGDRCQMK
jgi:hypothetical protein